MAKYQVIVSKRAIKFLDKLDEKGLAETLKRLSFLSQTKVYLSWKDKERACENSANPEFLRTP